MFVGKQFLLDPGLSVSLVILQKNLTVMVLCVGIHKQKNTWYTKLPILVWYWVKYQF